MNPSTPSRKTSQVSRSTTKSSGEFATRSPQVSDARPIWQLVRETGVLDLNSLYCYSLLCRDFADTSLVITSDDDLAAFATAYRPPACPEVLFVWQIGVASRFRRCGLAMHLLDELLRLPSTSACKQMEATVTPSNRASRGLFERFARRHGGTLEVGEGFSEELLNSSSGSSSAPPTAHEEEELLRIKPLPFGHQDQGFRGTSMPKPHILSTPNGQP